MQRGTNSLCTKSNKTFWFTHRLVEFRKAKPRQNLKYFVIIQFNFISNDNWTNPIKLMLISQSPSRRLPFLSEKWKKSLEHQNWIKTEQSTLKIHTHLKLEILNLFMWFGCIDAIKKHSRKQKYLIFTHSLTYSWFTLHWITHGSVN